MTPGDEGPFGQRASIGGDVTPTVVIVWTDPSVCCAHVGPDSCAVHPASS